MEDKRFFILKPPEGQTSSLSSSSSSSSSSTSSFGAIEEIRAQGGTLYLALGEASRQRKLLELASFPSMDEMPQAEGRRARQEHGVLVARGLAEGVAKIVEEATFTDALGTEFGLGYKLQRLERRAEESFADGYGQGAKDAAKGIELEFTKYADLLRQGPNISGGELEKVRQLLSMESNKAVNEEDGEESGNRQNAPQWLLNDGSAVSEAVSAACEALSKTSPTNLEGIDALGNGFWRKTLLDFYEVKTPSVHAAVEKARADPKSKLPSHLKSVYSDLMKIDVSASQ